MNREVRRVLDMINTHECAKELLDARVAQVNATGRYDNAIYCSSGEYVQRLRERGHTVHVVDTPRNLSPIRLMVAIWKTYRLLRKHRFDLVHTHTSVVGFVGRVAAFLARVPVVVHQVHGFHHHEGMAPLKQWGFIQVERVMGWLTDRLLFQNQADIEECRRRRIAAAHKVVWIGNGVQLGTFRPEQEPDTDPPIVLCVGRFEPVKNHRMILETARILRERGVWFSLQLVGDGVLQSTYEAWVRERSLESHVQFLGYRDDVPALIAQASVCVLVSNKEGLPRALLEAAAGGRPAVATDVMGSRDTLVDKTTGFLVPLNDCVALADRLQQLLDDEELRRSLGRQARSYAGEHFDERIVTDRIIGVYDELLGQAGSTGRA